MLPPTLPSRRSAGFLGVPLLAAPLLSVMFLAASSLAATLGTSPHLPSASPPSSPLLRGEVRWRATLESAPDSGPDSANVPWREPIAAIHAASGELLVADPAAGVVRVIVEDRPVAVLPTPPDLASGVWAGWSPSSLARGHDGSVLVGDPARGRLDRFAPDPERAAGAWSWIERVDLGGEPLAPRAMVETADGIVLVDGNADRLLEVRTAGEGPEVRVLDKAAIPGGWGRPMDLAVAEDGRLFVADADRHRVIRLDAEGRYLGAFGERGPFPGLFQDPVGLDLVGERLLVSDRLNHRISIFDLEGRSQGQWGMHAVIPRQGEGRIHYPVDVAVAPDGGRAAVVEPFERRVQIFDAVGEADGGPGTVAELPSLDGVTSHFGRGVAADGELVVLWEPETAAVVVFDWRDEVPIHVTSFGGPGSSPDRFGRVTAAAVDGVRQRIALSDAGLDRVAFVDLDRDPEGGLRLDPFMGRTAGTVSFDRIAAGVSALSGVEPSPLGPVDLAPIDLAPVDLQWLDDGSLLLLDERLGRLVVATPPPATRQGHDPLPSEVVAVWGPQGSGGPDFEEPIAMAVSPAGDAVAVLDAGPPGGAATIEVLSLDGLPRDSFELPAVLRSDDEWPLVPGGLAWTETGFAITDRLADRLLLLDERGVLRHETGTTGTADGELWSPRGLAVREDGTVIVVDTGNHRVQGFSADDASWRIVFSLGRASTRKRTPGPPGISE